MRKKINHDNTPQIGRYEERTFRWFEDGEWHERKAIVNVGGEIRPRPMSSFEYEIMIKRRGRSSFSDCMKENQACHDLPSIHGYISKGWFPHD